MITLLIILIVAGVLLQLLKPRVDPTLYSVVIVLIVLGVCLIVLNWLGLFHTPNLKP